MNDQSAATGRAATTERVRAFMSAFPDLRLGMDNLVIENDRVIYYVAGPFPVTYGFGKGFCADLRI